jgi:hypothetical protein
MYFLSDFEAAFPDILKKQPQNMAKKGLKANI